MKRIEKKILPEYFDAVRSGRKTFELRIDEDNVEVGDTIVLCEWNDGQYTGRKIERAVSYVLRDCPQYGLTDGYCVIALQPIYRPSTVCLDECKYQ